MTRIRVVLSLACVLSAGLVTNLDAQTLSASQPPAAAASTAAAGSAHSSWDNLSLFVGLDGSKQPQDLGINANMGLRVSANMGVPMSRRSGLGLQLGVGVNLSDAAVHVLDQIEGTSRRTQTFITAGLFQSVGRRMEWGLAYDMLSQNYYDRFVLGQLRGAVGYDATTDNEVGVWFTKSLHGDDGVMGDTAVRLDPITQVNGYITHSWPTAARTSLWAGVASGHHNIVWVLPDNSRDRHVLVYGAEVDIPLSDRFSMSGSANFLTPTATGTVDAFLGFTFYPGASAGGRRGPFTPRQTVANNPTFAANMRR